MTAKPPQGPPSLVLRLEYTHRAGFLAPYFEALMKGTALASRCPACGRVWWPPRPLCPQTLEETEWVTLGGMGTIADITRGRARLPFAGAATRQAFVLVALDGADNLAFGRLIGDAGGAGPGQRVCLAAPDGAIPHPAQAVRFVCDPGA